MHWMLDEVPEMVCGPAGVFIMKKKTDEYYSFYFKRPKIKSKKDLKYYTELMCVCAVSPTPS